MPRRKGKKKLFGCVKERHKNYPVKTVLKSDTI